MFDFGRVSPFEEEWAKNQNSRRVYRGGKIDEYVAIFIFLLHPPSILAEPGGLTRLHHSQRVGGSGYCTRYVGLLLDRIPHQAY